MGGGNMNKHDVLAAIVFAMCLAATLFLILFYTTMVPIVVMEFPDKVCLSVDSPRPEHSCENLPTRFLIQWRP